MSNPQPSGAQNEASTGSSSPEASGSDIASRAINNPSSRPVPPDPSSIRLNALVQAIAYVSNSNAVMGATGPDGVVKVADQFYTFLSKGR